VETHGRGLRFSKDEVDMRVRDAISSAGKPLSAFDMTLSNVSFDMTSSGLFVTVKLQLATGGRVISIAGPKV
jgi:hypothetical protein